MSKTQVEEEVDEEMNDALEEKSYEEIDKLQEMGINAADIKKLKDAGLQTVQSISMNTTKHLLNLKGMSEAKVQKIREAAQKIVNTQFITATQMLEKRKSVINISTGCTALDELLGGGIESGAITEAFGEFRTGKTQIAHTLAVTAQLPGNMKGGNGKVIYIDTEGTFRPDRIVAIAERFGVDPSAVLDNISYARAYTHEQQMNLLTLAAASMIEERYSLVIVDSCTALFRVDFIGRGELATRQNKLGVFLSTLTKMAEEFNVCVYVTNQVVSSPDGAMMFPGSDKKPIGGNIMAHACCTRLSLRKGKGEMRICKIYDSPCLPESEAIYAISDGGITNAKE